VTTNWTPIGPAPTINGFAFNGSTFDGRRTTDYADDASGRVVAVAHHPGDPFTIYLAAAGGGVWKSTDGGLNWLHKTDSQSTLFMGALALAPSDPNVVYAGTGEANQGPSKTVREFRDNIYYGRGVLKSINGGDSWTLLGSAEFDRRTISSIVVDPIDANTVYVAVGALATNGLPGNTGIWKSINGGATWINTTRSSISANAALSDLVMDPSDRQVLYAAVGAPSGDPANGVYKTTNGGASWTASGNFPSGAIDSAVGRIAIAIAPSAPQRVYAAIARSGPPPPPTACSGNCAYRLLRSDNGGGTWARITTPSSICNTESGPVNYLGGAGDYHNVLVVHPKFPDVVIAGGICLVASIDGGASWFPLAQGDKDGPHRDHHALRFDALDRLLNGNDGGIWRLDDGGWNNLNHNLQITQLVGLALDPFDPNLAYGGTQDTGSLIFVGDSQWWRLQRGDAGATAVSVRDSSRVYSITRRSGTSPSIFRRADSFGLVCRNPDAAQACDTWLLRVTGIDPNDAKNFYPPMVYDPAITWADRLVLGTTRVYETFDGGDLWYPISTSNVGGWSSNARIDALALAQTDYNVVYASAGGHMFVTLDHGATWLQRDVPGFTDHFRALAVEPLSAQIAYAARDRFGGGHVFLTTNAGQTWQDISGNLPDLPANTLAVDRRTTPSTLYVGTDNGVYVSTNRGAQWVRFAAGLPNVQVVELQLNPAFNILAAATHGRGVWEILVSPAP
jgi:photosystem II stability/assembly factor-like uncharacterized protein